jgi:uncharacterized protein (DUF433 family)
MHVMRFTSLIATAATAAVLGSAGVSIAGAANEPSASEPASSSTSTTAAAPSTDASTAAPASDAAPAPDARAPKAEGGKAEGARRHLRRKAVKAGAKTAADTIGISVEDLVAELKAGKTIAEIATAHGVDPQAVIDALVAQANERIDAAVAAGELTDEQAARAKEKLAAAIAKRVNEGGPRHDGQPAGERKHRRQQARRAAGKATADAIGISAAELAQELKSGKTIAEVAAAHGVDPQTVIDALAAKANEKIDTALSNGKISEERAARAKERLQSAITRRVNEGHRKRR